MDGWMDIEGCESNSCQNCRIDLSRHTEMTTIICSLQVDRVRMRLILDYLSTRRHLCLIPPPRKIMMNDDE